ncbi:hypothetical protein TSUD_361190 [Trifolium subterraneum]|uniref:REJ domain-containing protein n=1 Tax=Trifolium subterraneum TaxID=3900 RepID=A0A2Z6MY64_TRISU|nr:hypothetical protein TSUD_361190 [Trifolium subterraneum]
MSSPSLVTLANLISLTQGSLARRPPTLSPSSSLSQSSSPLTQPSSLSLNLSKLLSVTLAIPKSFQPQTPSLRFVFSFNFLGIPSHNFSTWLIHFVV